MGNAPSLNKGTLIYFDIRGRAEPIRLLLAVAEVEYEEQPVDLSTKALAGTEQLPFGQWPVWKENGRYLCQMDAICRYIGRKIGWYEFEDEWDSSKVDEILIGVESLRVKYLSLIYQSAFDEAAIEDYKKLHVLPESVSVRNGGAHLKYLENYFTTHREQWVSGTDGQWVAATEAPTIADVQVFDIFDLHLTLFENRGGIDLKEMYPKLYEHHEAFASIPAIAKYLASPKRRAKINNNGRC